MKIIERISSAVVGNRDLTSKPDTTYSDSDVLGAAGLAGKSNPLGIALTRLFAGDNRATDDIVRILSTSLVGKAWHAWKIELPRVEAEDMAKMVLAWFRHGTCRKCGGHGFKNVKGAPALSGDACKPCDGTGKMPFESQFPMDRVLAARWLLAEVEREQAIAGPAAMRALAPKLDL